MKSKNLHWPHRSFWWLLPPVAWAGMIFGLSAIPGDHAPSAPLPGSDKVVHFALYFGLAFLVWRALARMRARANAPTAEPTDRPTNQPTDQQGRSWAFQVGVVVALCAVYGALDELHQLFVPGRTLDVFDLLADAVGAFAGAELARRFELRRTSKSVD